MKEGMSGVERLKSRLYVPAEIPAVTPSPLNPARSQAMPQTWTKPSVSPENEFMTKPKTSSWLKIALMLATTFFLLAAGFAVLSVFKGNNWVSASNVDIVITGPVATASGGAIELQVMVTNNNQATLEGVRLLGEYPEGARSALDTSLPLPRSTAEIGTLKPGESVNETIRAILFGEKDSTQEIKLAVEYRLPGSGAIFDRTKTYGVLINSSPINLIFTAPETVDAGREITLTTLVSSGSKAVVSDLVVNAVYPPGFIFKRAMPAPSVGNHFWRLGDLPPGGERELKITGVIEGENEETKSFRITAGVEDPSTEGETDLVYNSLFKLVALRKTAVALDLTLNGSRGETVVANSNELLRGDLTFTNNLTVEIRDVSVEVEFSGAPLNRGAISATGGFYNSGSNKILWNKTNQATLGEIAPGERANLSFGFSGDAFVPNTGPSGPTIDLTLRFRGKKIGEDGIEDIELEFERQVKFNSILQLSAKALHGSGFLESGSLPPRVGLETTYTIVWSVANSPNEIAEAKVQAILPTYVRWVGQTSPDEEKIAYNPNGGEVLWELGTIKAGRGYSESPRQVSFQIALTPSLSQVGQTPELISAAVLTGIDRFTREILESRRPGLNTYLPQEPSFDGGDERVEQ